MLDEVMNKVDSILNSAKMPERHSFFQIKNFMIGKECTLQGQLWQTFREIRSRKDTLDAMFDQVAELEDNRELVDIQIEQLSNSKLELTNELEQRRHDVLIRKAKRERNHLTKNITKLEEKIKYVGEEVTYLVSAFETLSKAEPMKALDDIEAQRQYWNEKLTEEMNLRLILNHPLDSDFVKTVMALEDTSPVKKQMVMMLQRLQEHIVAERDRQRAVLASSKPTQLLERR
jgi:hypothetical protein